jgi:hypothetical protein
MLVDMTESERLLQRLVAEALIWEAWQLIAELADRDPLSFIEGCKHQTVPSRYLMTAPTLKVTLFW